MSSNMTKYDLAKRVSDKLGVSHREAKDLVGIFFKMTSDLLAAGHVLKFSNFGKFHLRDKVARPGRNPKTGEDKLIEKRRVVTFRGSRKLKDRTKYVKQDDV